MAARDGPIPRWSGSPPSAVFRRAASGDRRRSGPPSQAGSRRACRRRPRLRWRETRHGNRTTGHPPDHPPSPNGTRHSAARAAAAPSPRRIQGLRRGRALPRDCPPPPRPGRRRPWHARRPVPPERPPPETAPEIASGGREKDDVWKGLSSSRPNLQATRTELPYCSSAFTRQEPRTARFSNSTNHRSGGHGTATPSTASTWKWWTFGTFACHFQTAFFSGDTSTSRTPSFPIR